MTPVFQTGQIIELESASGPIERVVVEFDPILSVVSVCTRDEFARAIQERRYANSIGFNTIYVIRSREEIVDNSSVLKHNVQYEQAEHGQASSDGVDAGGGQQPPQRKSHG